LKTESILVVEDEPLVALEIKEDLEQLGYHVPEIISVGEEVLEAVTRLKPSLVLMDVHIEGRVDGIEAVTLLKARFDIPVIYLTAYSDRGTLERAAATEPDAYLLKPFDERELAANIGLALAKAHAGPRVKMGLRDSIALLDALGEPALLADLGDVIVHANASALELLGFDKSARLGGMPLSRFVQRGEAGDDGLPGGGEAIVRGADEGFITVYCRIEDIVHEDGERIGSLLLFESMSPVERRHLERSAATINRDLESLVPTPDSAGPDFETGGFLLPCSSGSGDIVEAFPVDARHAVFFDLDVAGHGGLASLVAFSVHTMIRDLATESRRRDSHSAAALIRNLNERYIGAKGSKPFFTIALGFIDGRTGEYSLARAGHPPALLMPSSGSCRVLSPKGVAVGVMSSLAVEEVEGALGPGDRLLLVSDGFLEGAFGIDSGADLGGLIASLEARRGLSIDELVDSLRALVLDRHSRATLRDDASLFLIGRPLQTG